MFHVSSLELNEETLQGNVAGPIVEEAGLTIYSAIVQYQKTIQSA